MSTASANGTPRYPIPDTPFYRAMRSGHFNRKGHALKGHIVYNGGFAHLVRTCCKDA